MRRQKVEPTIIVLRRDIDLTMWVSDHYDSDGEPDEDVYTVYPSATLSTGLDSGEDAEFAQQVTIDLYPNAIVLVSPPEPRGK